MEYINQVKDVEIIVSTTPRVFVKWKNTEPGRDKTECYERFVDDGGYIYYLNTNNRSEAAITKGRIFFDILEYLYKSKHA